MYAKTLLICLAISVAALTGLYQLGSTPEAAPVVQHTAPAQDPVLTQFYAALDKYAGSSNPTDDDGARLESTRRALYAAGYIKVYAHPADPIEAEASYEKGDTPEAQKQLAYDNAPTVSAPDLFNIYDRNEVRADNQYKGKLIKIEGTVGSVTKDAVGNTQVLLKADDIGAFFVPVVNPTGIDVAGLEPGQHITVTCTVTGKSIMSPTCDAGN